MRAGIRSTSAGRLSRKEAIEAGVSLYWSGNVCKNRHLTWRYVSTRECVYCAKERAEMRDGYSRGVDQSKRRNSEHDAELRRIDRELNGY